MSDVSLFEQRVQLFEKIKEHGLLWSYSKDSTLESIGEQTFIEHVLKYADFSELKNLMTIYPLETVLNVWNLEMKNDLRFKKLNLFLARIFFNMDVEADYFNGGTSERENKLRLLAT